MYEPYIGRYGTVGSPHPGWLAVPLRGIQVRIAIRAYDTIYTYSEYIHMSVCLNISTYLYSYMPTYLFADRELPAQKESSRVAGYNYLLLYVCRYRTEGYVRFSCTRWWWFLHVGRNTVHTYICRVDRASHSTSTSCPALPPLVGRVGRYLG